MDTALAARGKSRDGKKGWLQIDCGLLTDPAGRPVAVRVFLGNTGDRAAFTVIADVVRRKFGLAQMVMVGNRGMITSARIRALNQQEGGPARPDAYGKSPRCGPAIRELMASGWSPAANPVLAADRARISEELLTVTGNSRPRSSPASGPAGSLALGRSGSRSAR